MSQYIKVTDGGETPFFTLDISPHFQAPPER